MVRAGATITLQANGTADGYDSGQVRSAMVAELGKYFRVSGLDLSVGGSFAEYFGWPYTANLTITTQRDYGEAGDVASIVAHALYNATAYLPTVSAPQVQPQVGAGSGAGSGIVDSFADALAGLGKGIGEGVGAATKPTIDNLMGPLLLVGLVAVVLVVSVGGKTTRIGL